MAISDCKIINLPVINDARGNLSFIESDRHIDFQIKRVYYLFDVPGGSERGGHAHKNLKQFIIQTRALCFPIIKKQKKTR